MRAVVESLVIYVQLVAIQAEKPRPKSGSYVDQNETQVKIRTEGHPGLPLG